MHISAKHLLNIMFIFPSPLVVFKLVHIYLKKFLEQSDINQSGDVGLAEFVFYVREHEKNLRLQFSHLDKNKDGLCAKKLHYNCLHIIINFFPYR